jgi:hypothetical protein
VKTATPEVKINYFTPLQYNHYYNVKKELAFLKKILYRFHAFQAGRI